MRTRTFAFVLPCATRRQSGGCGPIARHGARLRTRRRRCQPRSASSRGGHAGGAEAGTLAGRERQVKSNPPCWGGERAGMRAGSSVGRPRWARILVAIGGSSMVAMNRRRPPHPSHAKTSMEKTLRMRSAHAHACCSSRWAAGDEGDGAGRTALGVSSGAEAGGDTGDGAIGGVADPEAMGGGRGGASGADAVDSGTGGTTTAGSSDSRGRRRALGASRPW